MHFLHTSEQLGEFIRWWYRRLVVSGCHVAAAACVTSSLVPSEPRRIDLPTILQPSVHVSAEGKEPLSRSTQTDLFWPSADSRKRSASGEKAFPQVCAQAGALELRGFEGPFLT